MASQPELIALTPRGSSIHKLESGGYKACDQEHHCHFTNSLYRAEEVVREMEQGYDYPYATSFHEITH